MVIPTWPTIISFALTDWPRVEFSPTTNMTIDRCWSSRDNHFLYWKHLHAFPYPWQPARGITTWTALMNQSFDQLLATYQQPSAPRCCGCCYYFSALLLLCKLLLRTATADIAARCWGSCDDLFWDERRCWRGEYIWGDPACNVWAATSGPGGGACQPEFREGALCIPGLCEMWYQNLLLGTSLNIHWTTCLRNLCSHNWRLCTLQRY